MKKMYMIFIMSLFILLSACSSKELADPIVLPASDDVTSITIVSGDITATSIDDEWMGEVMSILMDMESTAISSDYDAPRVEDYIIINFNCSDDTIKTIFFYEDDGKQYVEQPYQGIYIPAPALEVKITSLLESLDKCAGVIK